MRLRSKSISISRQLKENPTLDKFIKEVEDKAAKLKKTAKLQPKKIPKFKLKKITLKNANDRILPPKPQEIPNLFGKLVAQGVEMMEKLKAAGGIRQ